LEHWHASRTQALQATDWQTVEVLAALLPHDSGQLPILGPNESRTRGVGPQIGYNFTIGNTSIYTNPRGYIEFGSYRRLHRVIQF
jgi:hypothetical protein